MSEFDKRLQQDIAQLPDAVPPERDLWPGIAIAIAISTDADNDQNRGSRVAANAPVYAMAASIMCLALAIYALVFNSHINLQPEVLQPQPSLALAMQTQHQKQRQALLVSFANHTPLGGNWQAQMESLDNAEQAILAALDSDPNNHALLKMLKRVYQQQLSLLETVYHPKWQAI